ncbi:GbsR/MarR family transcriptional regulator [Pseudonocardia acaciae]|uniref:GbsR/MarR family transcriptional regulator n=1 Tax=Pseudonocardia acaciae TaxID=551276 RepID=UPI00048F7869|nr:MarR family transcriptional regulator [Pseudonocardia acaciae]
MSDRDEDALARFVEGFALELADAGMPRMAARVLVALLVTESGGATAGEIGELLRVSPAAVSGAVRYLGQLEMVVKEREPGERRDRYRLSDDMWYESIARKDRIYARWARLLGDGVKAAGSETTAGTRLEDTRRFFEFVTAQTPDIMRRWRAVRDSGH